MASSKAKALPVQKRKTKIIATLGPTSSTKEQIRELVVAGVNLFRLNFSHGEHKDHRKRVKHIRDLEKEYDRPLGVIGDLQGPKLRIGRFKDNGICLNKGEKIKLDLDEALGDKKRVNFPHADILEVLKVGDDFSVDDGKVQLKIVEKSKRNDFVVAEAVVGGSLSNNKGVNIPGRELPLRTVTDKDRKDLIAAVDMGVDWIAESFVQTTKDVVITRDLIKTECEKTNKNVSLMVKIEKPQALKCLPELIELADGFMVARGDLGVEIPACEVPMWQKDIVEQLRTAGKPIVVATQMAESMISSPIATRAETSDIANAVLDGADAVMLSAETASGEYPVDAVRMMDNTCLAVEKSKRYQDFMRASCPKTGNNWSDLVATASYAFTEEALEKNFNIKAIVTYTKSGLTARQMARKRSNVPILALTPNKDTLHRLTVSSGVHPVLVPDKQAMGNELQEAGKIAEMMGLAKKGDHIIVTQGSNWGEPGSTDGFRAYEVP